jgi:hypothetical protein
MVVTVHEESEDGELKHESIISVRYIEQCNRQISLFLLGRANLLPMPRPPLVSLAKGAVVEYRLQRSALIQQIQNGERMVEDLCDAHPGLIRAAKGVGRSLGETCPVCHEGVLRQVVYVFGDKLPASGVCPVSKADLRKFELRDLPVTCYAVEVCIRCRFNHLLRKWEAGGTSPARSKVAK